jgi:hypothetical protein
MRTERTPGQMAIRSLSLLCVLLVGFAGFVQAVHVHSDNSRLPSHECSVCSVAHAGIAAQAIYHHNPVFARAVLVVLPETPVKSSDSVFTLRIRPPPVA